MNQDAKDKGSDALPEGGQPLAPKVKEPSEKDVVNLFTKEDVDKVVSDRLSERGRELAALRRKVEDGDLSAQRLKEAEEKLARLEEAADAKELETLEGSPDLKALALKVRADAKAVREREAVVKQTEIEHGSAMERVKKLELLDLAQSVAKEFEGVDAADLLDLGLTGEEQMRTVAEKLAKAVKAAPPVIKADSAISSGLGVDLSGMTADEKLKEGFRKLKK